MRARRLDCAGALALLDERHDRALEPAEDLALHAHLDGCAPCRAAAAASDRVHGALLSEDSPPLPASFTDEVVARLDRAPGERRAARPVPTWLRAAAAVGATGAVAALAMLVLPLEAAAQEVAAFVPVPALPTVPPTVASLLGGIPVWAAAAGGAVAAAAALLGCRGSRE